MNYKTERLSYLNFEELDAQLTELRKKGWTPVFFREVQYALGLGYDAWITFKVNDA